MRHNIAGNLPLLARLSWSKFVPTNDGQSLYSWNISFVAATVQTKLPLSTIDMVLIKKDGRSPLLLKEELHKAER